MSSSGPSSPPPDPNQPTYVWSRIDPRRNRLIRDKLGLATRDIRKEIDKETQHILLDNRLNYNKTGVDEKILRVWASKIQSHAEVCHETIFCHHWNLLGHKRTGAFVRASSAILGHHIDQLANTEAHKARMAHRRRAGIGKSLAESYRSSGGSVRKQLEEKWDIEARELDLAASIARAQKYSDGAPRRPERSGNQPRASSPLDSFSIVRPVSRLSWKWRRRSSVKIPGEIVVHGGPLSPDDTDTTADAIEMLKKLGFGAEEQEWPSSTFGPVLPDVLAELKQAYRILKTQGFLVVDDPLNPLGDGRSWVLRLESTDKLPKDADPADLADECLQSRGIKVAARPVRDGHTFLVALWDSGRDPGAQTTHTKSGCADVTQPQRTEAVPETGEAGNLTEEDVGTKRAADVVKAQREIAEVRGQMNGDDDYDRLKAKYPTFMLFKICDRDPELKQVLLGVRGHHQRRALRFAKQVAASHNGIKLNTIEKAWDKYNPDKRTRQRAHVPHSTERVTGSPPKSR